MKNRLNTALFDVKKSAIREFNQLARSTPGCISLTLGEPDFNTPEIVRDACKSSLDTGKTHYIENNGTPALRKAIAAFETEHNGMDYAEDEIIVTSGATEALFDALFGILNPGDEVIVPTPAFVLYESIITMCRGKFVALDTSENGFQISRDQLEAAITPRTKAIILNTPNNPTGTVYTEETLRAIHDAVADREIFVICDDVYRQLIYTDSYHSFAEFRDLRSQLLVVQSYSKPYAMTGWRVGYLMGDRPVIQELAKVHQYAVVSAASISQEACIAALSSDVSPMLETYRKRRDYCLKRLKDMDLSVTIPNGAFYLFPCIEEFGLDSTTFCTRMVREALLAATPGLCFGSDRHIRLTYCYSDEQLKEGFDRLERFITELRRNHEA